MRSDVRPLTPDDTLDRALELFVENDVMALPIVADLQQRQVDGDDPPAGDRQRVPAARAWHGGTDSRQKYGEQKYGRRREHRLTLIST